MQITRPPGVMPLETMLSERQLSRGFRNWWQRWTPGLNPSWLARMLSEAACTHLVVHWADPLHSELPAHDADLVAETAFGLFAIAIHSGRMVQDLSADTRAKAMQSATHRVMLLRGSGRNLDGHMGEPHLHEAIELASRLQVHLMKRGPPIEVQPRLTGLGIVNACHPDAIAGSDLIEVKMSRHLFRLDDIRQVLIYMALIWRGTDRKMETITLTNPRLGVDWQFQIKVLANELSGKTASEFFEAFEVMSHHL